MALADLLTKMGLEPVQRDVAGGGSSTVHKYRVFTRTSPELPEAGQLVAVKEYRPEILNEPNQLSRIRQEAALGQLINHPNVVKTFGLVGDHLGDSREDIESIALLLEWIDGPRLDEWYGARIKPVGWDSIKSIAQHLVSALAELHANNVYHRDVKPENVMMRSSDSSAVLMDIGVAELSSNDESTLHTSVRDFVGSARYASPQFIMGETQYSATDDVYGLGATLFLLFTGSQIYSEVERKSVLPIAVVSGPARLSALVEGVPATMKVLLQGMLHRDPRRRPTLDEIVECLQNSDSAPYLTNELERQAKDGRSYLVLDVEQDGFFADLGGDTPDLEKTYTVVRAAKNEINVPSYNRPVTPEVWVAEATLKHIHLNVGYFAIHWRRWRDNTNVAAAFAGQPGQWMYGEGAERKVISGDRVLRKPQR